MIFTYPILLDFLNFEKISEYDNELKTHHFIDNAIFEKSIDVSKYLLTKDRNSNYAVMKHNISDGDKTLQSYKIYNQEYRTNFTTFSELLDYCKDEFKQNFRQMKIDEILEE